MDRFRVPGRAPDDDARPKHAQPARPADGRTPLVAPRDKSMRDRATKRALAPERGGVRRGGEGA